MKTFIKKKDSYHNSVWFETYNLYHKKFPYTVKIIEINDKNFVMEFVYGDSFLDLISKDLLDLEEMKKFSFIVKQIILDMFNSKDFLVTYFVHKDLALSNFIKNNENYTLIDPNSWQLEFDSKIFIGFKKAIDVLDQIKVCQNKFEAKELFEIYDRIVVQIDKEKNSSDREKLFSLDYFLNVKK